MTCQIMAIKFVKIVLFIDKKPSHLDVSGKSLEPLFYIVNCNIYNILDSKFFFKQKLSNFVSLGKHFTYFQ